LDIFFPYAFILYYFLKRELISSQAAIFFMITGYLYAFRDDYSKPVGAFALQKLKGLMYPFITLSFVVLLWNVLFYKLFFPSVQPENSIQEIFFLTITTYGYHALWFVPCLFYSSILFYVLRKYNLHHWICLLIITFIVVFSVIPNSEIFTYYPVRFFIRIFIGLMFIYLGYLLFKLLARINRCWKTILLIVTGALFLSSLMVYYFCPGHLPFVNIGVCHIEKPGIYLLLAFFSVTFIVLLSHYISNKVLSFIGKNSIIIMAFHMDLTVDIAWILVQRIPWNVNGTIQSAVVIMVEMAMLTVMILLINRFIPFIYQYHRIPFLNHKR